MSLLYRLHAGRPAAAGRVSLGRRGVSGPFLPRNTTVDLMPCEPWQSSTLQKCLLWHWSSSSGKGLGMLDGPNHRVMAVARQEQTCTDWDRSSPRFKPPCGDIMSFQAPSPFSHYILSPSYTLLALANPQTYSEALSNTLPCTAALANLVSIEIALDFPSAAPAPLLKGRLKVLDAGTRP